MVSGVKTPEQLAQEFVDSVDIAKTETHFGFGKSHIYAAEMLNSHGNQKMRLKEGFLAGYQTAKQEMIESNCKVKLFKDQADADAAYQEALQEAVDESMKAFTDYLVFGTGKLKVEKN